MPVYALLVWVVIGAVVGWLAPRIFKKVGPFGLVGDLVTGVVGALVAGYGLASLVAMSAIVSFLVALVGALLLLWIVRKVVKR